MTNGVTLKPLNTFAINALAHRVVTAYTETELLTFWQQVSSENSRVLVLGGGSNVLFLENYAGTVLLNRIRGIEISEDKYAWYLHVGAGEVWNDLVNICMDQNMLGMENLALIPGCVGSAPIQNISAYGVELKQLCEYVDILQLKNGKKIRLSAVDCQFSYRESIFKHNMYKNYVIVSVGLRLNKDWHPVLNYGDLSSFDELHVTPRQIYDTVCSMRRSRLPDPALIGNAGSFFKNPIISAKKAKQLLTNYPDAPYYLQSDGRIKFAAGWLIDRSMLKGYRIGGAAVHDKQALILINSGQATSGDIVALARYIRHQIAERFDIWLEPEVHFIATHGYVDAVKIIS